MKAPRDYSGEAGPRKGVAERFPITWNHVIEKESLNINKLEHALIEKVEHFFGICSSEPLNCSLTRANFSNLRQTGGPKPSWLSGV